MSSAESAHTKTFTVYLGSSGYAAPVFKDAAKHLGSLIGDLGHNLVYGGMDAGLMGILAQNALTAGAHVTGIIPQNLQDSERILGGLSETILVRDLWERKKKMFQRADAIISLPGGYGTLDESLEVLYWGNLKLHNKPLVLVNIEGFWDSLILYFKTLPDFDERFLIICDNVDDIFSAIEHYESIPSPKRQPERLPHFEDEIVRHTKDPIVIDEASIENTYYAVCALGLKQLAKHSRAIGFLNDHGQFDLLMRWFEKAQQERFVTEKCLDLFQIAQDELSLRESLKHQDAVNIDLHAEKWGEN